MKSSVIVFPGSNCDRDVAVALKKLQFKNSMIWHKETELPKSDLIVIPEAELPYPINDMRFSKFIDRTNSANKILLGAWFFNDAKLFNTIYNPENKNIYKKQHLVPFGEYIPFFSSLRAL